MEAAADRVPWFTWSLDPTGRPRPQAIPRPLVVAMIRLLDVKPGNSILEIGTGCGYNTAILAHLVSATGHVISMDIDLEVVARVQPMLAAAGLRGVRVLCGDGRQGHPAAGPYDGLISWAAVSEPPAGWRAQLRSGAIAVVPTLGTPPTVRRLRSNAGGFEEEASIEGGFVPLTTAPAALSDPSI